MGIFKNLKRLRRFEKRHLPQLTSIEDVDVIREIGFHQEQGQPLTLKHLLLLDIAPPATVQRRLKRLLMLGMIRKRRTDGDGRLRMLTISPRVGRVYEKYGRLLDRLCAPRMRLHPGFRAPS